MESAVPERRAADWPTRLTGVWLAVYEPDVWCQYDSSKYIHPFPLVCTEANTPPVLRNLDLRDQHRSRQEDKPPYGRRDPIHVYHR